MALACFYRKQYQNAAEHLKESRLIAEQTGDRKWQINVMIVESRAHRETGDYATAEEVANKAIEKAQLAKHKSCEIESLIARGEARLERKKYKEAREDFDGALHLGKDNAKTYAVCQVHLARAYLGEGEIKTAEEHFRDWHQVEKKVDNPLIHDFASEVSQKITELAKDFVVASTDRNLDYKYHRKRLRAYLMQQARRRYKTDQEIAGSLGVSRQAAASWRD